jgi:hypothetical protein
MRNSGPFESNFSPGAMSLSKSLLTDPGEALRQRWGQTAPELIP